MKYLGGKQRLGLELSNVLKFLCPESYTNYLEPFCGALGVFRHMTDKYNCLATDIQPDIILLWQEIKNNKLIPPKNVTETYYKKVKNQPGPSALRGFVGFLCSWNGMFFAGLAIFKGTKRNVTKEATNDIKKIKPLLQKKNVKFNHMSYDKHNPKNTLIYCDPPYKGTIGYTGTSGSFDHDKFWNTIRKWSKNNMVIVSEETAPKDFKCIWKKKYSRGRGFKTKKNKGIKKVKGKDVTEKIFVHETIFKKIGDKLKNIYNIEANKKKTKKTIKK